MNTQLERTMIDAIPDGMLLVDREGRILRANAALQHMSGYTEKQMLGQTVDIFLPPDMRASHASMMRRYFGSPSQRSMGQKGSTLRLHRRDGRTIPIDVSLSPCQLDTQDAVLAFVRDLSQLRRLEDRINYQANHDSVTGLANRWQFMERLGHTLSPHNDNLPSVALIMLDLDHFKAINDSYGHNVGDDVLVQVAERLRSALRPADLLARLGGDEFMVMLRDVASETDATDIAQRLLESLATPFKLHTCHFTVTASAGIALAPRDTQEPQTLMRFADMALYQAKDAGRACIGHYTPEMSWNLNRRRHMYNRLRHALSTDGLELHYQPQVDLSTGQVISVEALLRWTDAELGCVPPDQFVPLAESTGLMQQLGDWVLETACSQLAKWRAEGIEVRMAVNLSAQQFLHHSLVDQLDTLMARYDLRPDLLELELTESEAMANPTEARSIMQRLAGRGFQLAIDDFGTGHSSLAYLQLLPVDRVKIDRSFVSRLASETSDQNLVQGIIGLVHSLGMEVIAEGVETGAQLDFLEARQCNGYQGWFFSKAIPPCQLRSVMSRPDSRRAANDNAALENLLASASGPAVA